MESMTVQSQKKPTTTTSRAAEAALDLRSYMGEGAHAGQAFSIDGAFGNVGEGKFTVVSSTHVELDCPKIDAWFHKGSGVIVLKDGIVTITLKNTGGEPTTLTGTYGPERYWLNLDLKVGIVNPRVQVWRNGRHTNMQSGLTKYWLTPKAGAVTADAEGSARLELDLRNYFGEDVHAGQRFAVRGLFMHGTGQFDVFEPNHVEVRGEIKTGEGPLQIKVRLGKGIAVVQVNGEPRLSGPYAPDGPGLRLELHGAREHLVKVFRMGRSTVVGGGNLFPAVVFIPADVEATTDWLAQLCDAQPPRRFPPIR